jgi:hypothetical protein
MNTEILFLVKFFSNKKYADEFIDGKIHLKRLSYFRKLESSADSERSDNNEALSHWLQPKGLVVKFNVPGVGEVEITEKDLAGPISMSIDYHEHLHVFCMHAMRVTGFELINGEFDCAEHEVSEIEAQLKVDERNFVFGEYAVVVRAVDFLARIKETLKGRGDYFRGRLVEYYDDKTFNGEIPTGEIPFWKQKKYSHQNEFRICVNTKTKGDDPLNIEMGNISDICALIESSKINELFKVHTKKV